MLGIIASLDFYREKSIAYIKPKLEVAAETIPNEDDWDAREAENVHQA